MKRTRVALAALQISRPQNLSPVSDNPNPRSWFRFENKEGFEDDDAADVYIYDEIGESWFGGIGASAFVEELEKVDATDLRVHINSPGGDVFDGLAIYNALRSWEGNVTVYIDGLAASAASFIAQAGDEVIMSESSMMMIHDAAGFAMGPKAVMDKTSLLLDKVSANIANIYAARSGESAEVMRGLMLEDTWFTDKEAVDNGLADSISAKKAETTEAEAKNKWASAFLNFKHAGRSEAPPPEVLKASITNKMKEPTVARSTSQPEDFVVDFDGEEFTSPEALQARLGEITARAKKGDTVFVVNGAEVTDFAAVQDHINNLENQHREAQEAGRKAFVQSLVASNKITAPHGTSLESFVAGLSSEQYLQFEASWAEAPSHALLAKHTGAPAGPVAPAEKATSDRIKDLEETLAHLRNGGMKPEALKNTSAFKELEKLRSDEQN